MKTSASWGVAALLVTAGCSSSSVVGAIDGDAAAGGDGAANTDAPAGGDGDADTDGDGDADRFAEIAASFEAERLETNTPGLAVAIIEGGELAWSQGFGSKEPLGSDAVTPSTLFSVATLSSSFTALAVLQLVDQGLVELDAPVVEYISGLTLDSDAESVPRITVRHLLTQTSGFQNGWFGSEWADWPNRNDSVLGSYLTGSTFASSHHLVAPPGDHCWPSLIGMAVAGLLVERLTDEWFADHMKALFEQLGMTRTTFRQEEVLADGDFVIGRVFRVEVGPTDRDNPWLRPGVGAWSSVQELARYAEFLLHGDEAILSQALLDEALSPQVPIAGWESAQGSWGLLDGGLQGLVTLTGDLIDSYRPYDFRWLGGWQGDWDFGSSVVFMIIPSHDFALMSLASRAGMPPMPRSELLATTSILDLPELAPSRPGDDRDPATYVGTYRTDGARLAGLHSALSVRRRERRGRRGP